MSLLSEIHQTVLRFPNRPAIVDGEETITYRDLFGHVSTLSREISDRVGTGPHVAAILMRHGASALQASLAAMAARKIATCLDIDAHLETLRTTCRHSLARLIITDAEHEQLADRIASLGQQIMVVDPDVLCSQANVRALDAQRSHANSLNRPALIIYSSGSTARPKGVLHSQKSLLHNATFHRDSLSIGSDDREVFMAKLSTISGWIDTMRTLLGGASLLALDQARQTPSEIRNQISSFQPTILHLVPSLYRQFCRDENSALRAFESLRVLHLGGEAPTRADFELFRRMTPDKCVLINSYGSSEIATSWQGVFSKSSEIKTSRLPLNRPMAGMEVLIRAHDQDVPLTAGVATRGEMIIRSEFAALGYWRDPEATEKVFRSCDDGRVDFATGDVGLLQADGSLTYAGRIGGEVKIRGKSVDLAEVESAILETGLVRNVAVKAIDADRETKLVAYVEGMQSDRSTDELAGKIAQQLDAWKQPGRIEVLNALPTLGNGKVDRRRLGAMPSLPAPDDRANGEAISPTEQCVMDIWRSVLPESMITPDSSFTLSGGDSIAATELALRLEQTFSVTLTTSTIYHFMTPRRIAEHFDNATKCRQTLDTEFLDFDFFDDQRDTLLCIGDQRPVNYIRASFFDRVNIIGLKLDGTHTARFQGLSIEEQVDQYLTALSALSIELPLGIVGFSYGGLLAHQLGLRYHRRGWNAVRVLLLEPSIKERYRIRRRPQHLEADSNQMPESAWRQCSSHYHHNIDSYRVSAYPGDIRLFGSAYYLRTRGRIWEKHLPGIQVKLHPGVKDHLDFANEQPASLWLPTLAEWIEAKGLETSNLVCNLE